MPEAAQPQPKTIKRYANRKLYDTERSCYVTLDDISLMIRAGEPVQVIDNKSGEDLTSVTLAQIIFEAEKKKNFMPLSLLVDLIQHRGDAIGEFARERVDKVQAAAQDFRETAQKLKSDWEGRIDRVMHRRGDEAVTEQVESASKELVTEQKGSKLLHELSDLLASSRTAIDELQKGIEDRVKGPVGKMSRYAHLGRDMREIQKRLDELEGRLERINTAEK